MSPMPAQLDAASINAAQGVTISGIGRASTVGPAGDVNGDGADDLVIGAVGAHPSFGAPARSYVVFGSTSALGGAIHVADLDGTNGFALGNSGASLDTSQVARGASDVNGDGLADLVVGQALAGALGGGEAYVVFGSITGFAPLVDLQSLDGVSGFTLRGAMGDEDDRVGWSVDGVGDVNGDGVDDLVVGAPGFNYGQASFDYPGKAFVVFGATGPHTASVDLSELDGTGGFVVHGDSGIFFPINGSRDSDDAAGTSVSGMGDFNGDGYDDILVGAPGYEFSAEAYVVFGSPVGFPARVDVGSTDGAFGGYMGLLDGTNGFAFEDPGHPRFGDQAIAAAGDFNGDGLADVIIGHSDAGSGGRVYIVFGVPEPPGAALALVAVAGLRVLRGTLRTRRPPPCESIRARRRRQRQRSLGAFGPRPIGQRPGWLAQSESGASPAPRGGSRATCLSSRQGDRWNASLHRESIVPRVASRRRSAVGVNVQGLRSSNS
jgi:hypothetical protein